MLACALLAALTAAVAAPPAEDCCPAVVVGSVVDPVVVGAIRTVGGMADVRAGGAVGTECGVAVVGVTVVS